MKRIMQFLDPNKELPRTSVVWYWVALALIAISVFLCYSNLWQTPGFVDVVYGKDGPKRLVDKVAPNRVSIAPQFTSIIWAVLIYGAMLVRKYVRSVKNIPVLMLVLLNVIFIASLIESFLPAQSVKVLWLWEVNPQSLLVFAALMTWCGMRAISGVAIILLMIASLSRVQSLNESLGIYGAVYALCGLFSLLIQCKLPYMVPEGGWLNSLKQDFGRGVSYIGSEARQNLLATGNAVQTGVKMAATAVAAYATGGASVAMSQDASKMIP